MPTINEIKKLYPVGTVFYPAHLSPSGKDRPGNHITIQSDDEFEIRSNGDIVIKSKPNQRLFPFTPLLYENRSSNYALVISSGSLPSRWCLKIEPGVLDLVNAFRDFKSNTPIDYPYYSFIDNDGTGNRVSPSSKTEITTTQFVKLCEDLGIKKSTSSSIPSEWACYIKDINTQERVDLFNAYRESKDRGLDVLSFKDIKNEPDRYFHEDACRSCALNDRSVITFSQFEEHCKSLGVSVPSTVSSSFPKKWMLALLPIRDDAENLKLVSDYRKHIDKGFDELTYSEANYKYIHEDGYRVDSTDSSRQLITFTEFEEYCKSLGVMKSSTSSSEIPLRWAYTINTNNYDLIRGFRKYYGLDSDFIVHDYIREDGCKNNGASGYPYLTDAQFKSVCDSKGILPIEILGGISKGKLDVNNLPSNLGEIEHLRHHPEILNKLIERCSDKSLKGLMKNRGGSGTEGFSWSSSPEGHSFWCDILGSSLSSFKPETFYKKYPKSKPLASSGDYLGAINFLKNHPKILDRLKEICGSKFEELKFNPTGIFTWSKQKEGHDFWSAIMNNTNIDIFYTIYSDVATPKTKTKTLGAIEFLRHYPDILDKLKSLTSDGTLDGLMKEVYNSADNGGFNWSDTEEYKKDNHFWPTILGGENPEHYYTLYPKGSSIKTHPSPIVYTKGDKVKIISKTTGVGITSPAVQKALEKSPYGLVHKFDTSKNTYAVFINGMEKEAMADFRHEDLIPYTDDMSVKTGYDSPIKSSRKTKLPQVEMIAVKTRRII